MLKKRLGADHVNQLRAGHLTLGDTDDTDRFSCNLAVIVPQRPFFIGSPGWVRSRAWIWLTWGFVGQDVRIKIPW